MSSKSNVFMKNIIKVDYKLKYSYQRIIFFCAKQIASAIIKAPEAKVKKAIKFCS